MMRWSNWSIVSATGSKDAEGSDGERQKRTDTRKG
jgi:hypothetical protein